MKCLTETVSSISDVYPLLGILLVSFTNGLFTSVPIIVLFNA